MCTPKRNCRVYTPKDTLIEITQVTFCGDVIIPHF